MFRSLTMLIAVALFSTAALAEVKTGEPAPNFSATDTLTGKPVSLEALKGKIVVLEWNNFECPFVKKFYSTNTMQSLQKAAVKDGVVWISINSGAPGKEGAISNATNAQAAVRDHGSNASHYLLDHDGTIGHLYGAKATPHMYVIDKEGTLVYQGAIDSIKSPYVEDIAKATNYVTEALNSLKAGTPVKVGTTQAYGCFVKY